MSASDPTARAAPDPPAPRGPFDWVATSNPLYAVSAALFLLGLRLSFGRQTRDADSLALMAGLSGYTLLLAAAAVVLVRFARVWDDVRTVLLLVVLMFLATSVTFDELLVLNPARGRWFFVGGLVFAVGLTEVVLRGIGLRLPPLFRLPYHAILGVFFLYPLALAERVRDPHSEALMWGLWGFAPVAGVVFLTLLPAVRRGPGYVRGNGSPWPWPFYPWSVFVFLAAAVCGRAFLLCWSFHLLPGGTELVFGPYFLAPFVLALAVLVLELGIVGRHRVTTLVGLVLPLAAAGLSGVGHVGHGVYAEFLGHFTTRLGGTPLFVALAAACAFYLLAWARGVRLAPDFLTAAVAALALVRPDAPTFGAADPQPGVLVAAVALQVAVSLWRRERWRLVAGAAALLAWAGVLAWRAYRTLREEVPGLDYLVLGLLLLPLAVFVSLKKGGALDRPAGGAAAGGSGPGPVPSGGGSE